MTPEQIRKCADALASIGPQSPAWIALMAVCEMFAEECAENLTLPDSSSEKRHYWAGAAALVGELQAHLCDLQSGAYKRWPMMKSSRVEDSEDVQSS